MNKEMKKQWEYNKVKYYRNLVNLICKEIKHQKQRDKK
jgi:hypothetical protein